MKKGRSNLRIHPIFGIVAIPLLAAGILCEQYWYEFATTHRVSQLISTLKDKDPNIRRGAAEALSTIGTPAVEPLIAALNYKDPDARQGANETFGTIGRQHAFNYVLCDRSEGAVEALGMIGKPAVEPLIAALKTPHSAFQLEAEEQALAKIGEPAIEPLIATLDNRALLDKFGESYFRKIAFEVLVAIGTPAIGSLIAALKDSDPHVRQRAAEALGKIKDPRAIDPLTGALKDSNSDVRETAARVLGAIKDFSSSSPAARDKQTAGAQTASLTAMTAHLAGAKSLRSSGAPGPAPRDKQLAAHLAKANALWSSGHPKEALEECDAALNLDQTNVEASSLREKFTRALDILNGTSK